MKLNRFNKINNRQAEFILLGIIILSAIIIVIEPFLLSYVIITDIILFLLLAIFIKDSLFLEFFLIISSVQLFYLRETIDIEINKSRYYNAFQPMMKYDCLAGFNLIERKIDKSVFCKSMGLSQKDSIALATFIKNDKLINHLKDMGCYEISINHNDFQLWFNDDVVCIKKNKDNSIVYETSNLE
ncbi:MAG: hypothetical protein RL516_1182 [Bacteroidota bacterium]|jgi:hypothetical protein